MTQLDGPAAPPPADGGRGARLAEAFEGDLAGSPDFTWYSHSAGASVAAGWADSAAVAGRSALLRISAGHPPSPDQGANLKARRRTGHGTYAARLRAAGGASDREGIVTGFFTYFNDGRDATGAGLPDNSEIDFEWLAAEPQSIYLAAWTHYDPATGAGRRAYRKINLAAGRIEYTRTGASFDPADQCELPDSPASQPAALPALAGYDASARYYEYGFRWEPAAVTWWIVHPATGRRLVLWRYAGPCVPRLPAYAMANLWHTDAWAPEAWPQATGRPLGAVACAIDWISYEPLPPPLA